MPFVRLQHCRPRVHWNDAYKIGQLLSRDLAIFISAKLPYAPDGTFDGISGPIITNIFL